MTTATYFGCLIQQRSSIDAVTFFLFQARVNDIKRWAGIKRIEDIREGTQRVLRESRANAIRRFLESDPVNTIPSSILLAFEPNQTTFSPVDDELIECFPTSGDIHNGCSGQLKWGFLSFDFEDDSPEHLRPALIVDGQHRLYGMYRFQAEDIPMSVIGLLDASSEEQAFQFVVVNNKIVRVPTDNVKSIIADLDLAEENQLAERLLKAGVRYGDMSPVLRDVDTLPNSPFKGLLDWPSNREGTKVVPVATIEQSLKYLKALFTFLEEDEDSLLSVYLSMWRSISAKYAQFWGIENRFMTKVNLNAVNEFVSDRLKMAWEFGLVRIFEPENVEQQTSNIIEPIPVDFWTVEWDLPRIQDNANVREMIKRDLVKILENSKLRQAWHSELKLPVLE